MAESDQKKGEELEAAKQELAAAREREQQHTLLMTEAREAKDDAEKNAEALREAAELLRSRTEQVDIENAGLTDRVQKSELRVKLLEGSKPDLRDLPLGDLLDVQNAITEAAFNVQQIARETGLGSAGVCEICLTRGRDWSLFCGHRGCKECFTQIKDNAVRRWEALTIAERREPAPCMECHTCRMKHPLSRSVRGDWQLCGHASY